MKRLTFIFAVIVGFGLVGSSILGAQAKPPDVTILTGNPMGGVKFEHKKHVEERGVKCEECHHPSKPENPLKSDQQKCSDCHTKTATAPMKTKIQAAFHDPMFKKGVCADCHIKQNAEGKKAPVKCVECHKKENK
jgi:hypothetical protein